MRWCRSGPCCPQHRPQRRPRVPGLSAAPPPDAVAAARAHGSPPRRRSAAPIRATTPLQVAVGRLLKLLLVIAWVAAAWLLLNLVFEPPDAAQNVGQIYLDAISIIFSVAPSGLFFMVTLTHFFTVGDVARYDVLLKATGAAEALAYVRRIQATEAGLLTDRSPMDPPGDLEDLGIETEIVATPASVDRSWTVDRPIPRPAFRTRASPCSPGRSTAAPPRGPGHRHRADGGLGRGARRRRRRAHGSRRRLTGGDHRSLPTVDRLAGRRAGPDAGPGRLPVHPLAHPDPGPGWVVVPGRRQRGRDDPVPGRPGRRPLPDAGTDQAATRRISSTVSSGSPCRPRSGPARRR